jgi:FlaA1/EpsC-like NDP-sugar epimerase
MTLGTHLKAPLTGLRVRYLMVCDLLGIWFAIVASFAIRYEALIAVWPYLEWNWTFFLVAPAVRLPLYWGFRLYRRLWRYASTRELRKIVEASVLGSLLIYIVNFWVFPLLGIPYMRSGSVWLLEGVLSMMYLGGSRFLLRLLQERYRPHELARVRGFVQEPSRVLIVGAGDAGAMMLREMLNNPHLSYHVAGLVDDDPAKRRHSLYGVPVLGNRADIPELVRRHRIDHVIIAMPAAPGPAIRDIVRICEEAGIRPLTMPAIYELLDGTVRLDQVRQVQIDDLLRREPVQTDTDAVRELLRGRRVLVTGAGGSIGRELCRQILRGAPAELVLLGHGENSIFEAQNELLSEARKLGGATAIRSVIADIRFYERIRRIFVQVRPEVVFHAAAHKHVPLMEENSAEAISNNVLGTRNMVQAALHAGVERFVMISTDKAVNPTSIMGASKRAAELIVHEAAADSGRPYVAVRFGNVLGSRGSVVLTFQQQIAAGGPVTVTDPEMKRFFMTIPEAVQLVLQASVLGTGGEVFLLDMGEPVKIVDLARDLIRLSGLEVERDIEIQFTGLRPGEKLFEELFVTGEQYGRTRHNKIFIAGNASSFVPENLDATVVALEQAAEANDRDAIVRNLQNLIPEYKPPARRLAETGANGVAPQASLRPLPKPN